MKKELKPVSLVLETDDDSHVLEGFNEEEFWKSPLARFVVDLHMLIIQKYLDAYILKGLDVDVENFYRGQRIWIAWMQAEGFRFSDDEARQKYAEFVGEKFPPNGSTVT